MNKIKKWKIFEKSKKKFSDKNFVKISPYCKRLNQIFIICIETLEIPTRLEVIVVARGCQKSHFTGHQELNLIGKDSGTDDIR